MPVPSVIGVGAVGVTPNSAASPMTATGQTLPGGVTAGKFLLMCVMWDTGATVTGTQTVSTPAGWTFVTNVGNLALSGGGIQATLFGKVAVGGDAVPSPSFAGGTTGTNGAVGIVQVVALNDVDLTNWPGTPTSIFAGSSGGNAHSSQNIGTITGFTPTQDNTLQMFLGGKKDDFTTASTPSPSDSLTYTNSIAASTTNSSDASMVVSFAPQTTAATISGKTVTLTGGASSGITGRQFAIKGTADGEQHSGSVSISGAGAISVSGTKTVGALVLTSGKGTVTTAATKQVSAPVAISGKGNLATVGQKRASNAVVISGGGAIATVGGRTVFRTVSISGGGAVSVSGQKRAVRAVAVSGGGATAAAGRKDARLAMLVSAGGSITVAGAKRAVANVSISGKGTTSVSGQKVLGASVGISGGGMVSTSATRASSGGIAISGGGMVAATGSKRAVFSLSISGGGSVGGSGSKTALSAIVISGGGFFELTGGANPPIGDSLTLSGGGSVSIIGRKSAFGSATLSGGGNLTIRYAAGEEEEAGGAVVLSGGGNVLVIGAKAASGAVTITGGGYVAVSPGLPPHLIEKPKIRLAPRFGGRIRSAGKIGRVR